MGALRFWQPVNRLKDKRAFVVLDDCMFDNKWIKDTVIRNIFMNGRHYKLKNLRIRQKSYPNI